MAEELNNFRAKYPQYSDVGDSKLANMLAKKFPDAYGDLLDKYEQQEQPTAVPGAIGQQQPAPQIQTIDKAGMNPKQLEAAEELARRGKIQFGDLMKAISAGEVAPPTMEEMMGQLENVKLEGTSTMGIPGSRAIGESSSGAQDVSRELARGVKGAKGVLREAIPVLRPTIEGLSSVAGASGGLAVGVGTGPFAPAVAAAGGAGGYTAAKNVLDFFEDWATLPPEVKTRPAMEELKSQLGDFKTGLTFELGGPAAVKILSLSGRGVVGGFKKVKDILRKNAPAMTEQQISKRAADIIQENQGGLAQYEKNLAEAQGVNKEIPDFQASIGQQTGDPGLIKLQRGLEAQPGIASELGEVNKAQNIDALEEFLRGKFSGGQTVDDVLENLTAQKAGLKTKAEQATKAARIAEEVIPAEAPQVTGRKITEKIAEKKAPAKALEKEYWEKVPNYEMTPTETDRVFKDLSQRPSTARKDVRKFYKDFTERKGGAASDTIALNELRDTEREINGIIFDRNADPNLKRVLGQIKTAINNDLKALGEAAEQGDFATHKGGVVHPKALRAELENINTKLGLNKSHLTEATVDVDKTYKALEEAGVPGTMQQRGEGKGSYAERIARMHKMSFGKDAPIIPGKEEASVTHAKARKVLIEETLSASEPAKDAATAYANAKAFSNSQVRKKFKTGVMKELEMQGDFQGGKKLPAGKRPLKLMDVESADKFIAAVGKEDAGNIMLRHYAEDMATKVKTGENGRFISSDLSRWVKKHGSVLERYGIKNEFKTADKAHKAMQEAFVAQQSFDNSIAAKMLNSDPEKAIARAFEGGEGISSKNTGQIMFELLRKTKGDKNARRGLENAFKDFMFTKAQTTAKTLSGGSQLSKANIEKAIERYKPAMKVLYRTQPEKIKALNTVQKALLIMNRTAKGVGGGSDTAEKGGTLVKILGSIAHVPGVRFGAGLTKFGLGRLKNLNERETTDFLARLLYDPELAGIIHKAYSKNAPAKATESALRKYLNRAVVQTGETITEGFTKKKEQE